MTGDTTDNRPRGERPRRGSRRESTVLDLTAESVAVSPGQSETGGEAGVGPAVPAAEETPGPDQQNAPASESVPGGEHDAARTFVAATPSSSAPDLESGPVHFEGSSEVVQAHSESTSGHPDQGTLESAAAELGLTQPGSPSDSTEPAGEPAAPEDDAPRSAVPPVSAGPVAAGSRPLASRPSLLGPALAGLFGGFVGAALLAGGFYLFGPAGDIGDRLAGIEAGLGERASRRTVETLEKRVAGLDGSAQALRSDTDALNRRVDAIPAKDLPALFGRMDRLERNVADIASQPQQKAEGASAPAAPQPPPLVAARESAVLSIALLLRDALGRGAPYGRELEALQGARVDQARIDALKPFATSGAPSAAALAAEFAPIGERIANPPPPPANTVTDRISTSLTTLFKVRPVGEARGDSPAALSARAEAALKRGSLVDAAAALDKLPPAEAGPAEAFRATLKSRIAANAAADSILSRAVDELLAAAKLPGGAAQ